MVYDKDESGHAPDQPYLFEKSWLIAKLPMKCCRTDKKNWKGMSERGQIETKDKWPLTANPFQVSESLRMG